MNTDKYGCFKVFKSYTIIPWKESKTLLSYIVINYVDIVLLMYYILCAPETNIVPVDIIFRSSVGMLLLPTVHKTYELFCELAMLKHWTRFTFGRKPRLTRNQKQFLESNQKYFKNTKQSK